MRPSLFGKSGGGPFQNSIEEEDKRDSSVYDISGKSVNSFLHSYLRKKSSAMEEMSCKFGRSSVFKISSQVMSVVRKDTTSSRGGLNDDVIAECRISFDALSISDKPQDMSI